jgi:hypothetical protein
MKFTAAVLTLAAMASETAAFSPSLNRVSSSSGSVSARYRRQSTIIYAGNNDEPNAPKNLDPLVEALTKTDEKFANTPTTKVPLLGEIPKDGSILVLVPVAIIAVVGFIMSFQIAIQSKDLIASQLDELNTVLSTPPAKKTKTFTECRGLCSDQGDQLDTMKGFMEGLSKKKATMIEEPKPKAVVQPVVEKVVEVEVAPAAAPEPVVAPAPAAVAEPAVVPAAALEPVVLVPDAPSSESVSMPATVESVAVVVDAPAASSEPAVVAPPASTVAETVAIAPSASSESVTATATPVEAPAAIEAVALVDAAPAVAESPEAAAVVQTNVDVSPPTTTIEVASTSIMQ